jgi:ribosomal protein S18 acetylase RimI-like enzyme
MPDLQTITFRAMDDSQQDGVIALWGKAGLTRAYNKPERDIALARRTETCEILVGMAGKVIVASAMIGHDGHRGNLYYFCVDPDCQQGGIGRQMMDEVEAWLKDKGIWKLNLMVRATNEKVHGFYEALGYETQPRTVFTKWLEEPPATPRD